MDNPVYNNDCKVYKTNSTDCISSLVIEIINLITADMQICDSNSCLNNGGSITESDPSNWTTFARAVKPKRLTKNERKTFSLDCRNCSEKCDIECLEARENSVFMLEAFRGE